MTPNSDKIKIALLAIILVTLVVQTFYLVSDRPVSRMTTPDITLPGESDEPKEEVSTPTTTISFNEIDHNFGKVMQESENKKVFTFTNTGTEPLTIANAVGSCGCTIPTYPKEPIAPGKTGEIVVVYKPGQQKGSQTKTITITANTEPLTTMLMIRADVVSM
ncbi:MAG: DUF1573 domain-containing protein [Bacteroidota bacterium]